MLKILDKAGLAPKKLEVVAVSVGLAVLLFFAGFVHPIVVLVIAWSGWRAALLRFITSVEVAAVDAVLEFLGMLHDRLHRSILGIQEKLRRFEALGGVITFFASATSSIGADALGVGRTSVIRVISGNALILVSRVLAKGGRTCGRGGRRRRRDRGQHQLACIGTVLVRIGSVVTDYNNSSRRETPRKRVRKG